MLNKSIFLALVLSLSGASTASAGDWIMVQPPTFVKYNECDCTITWHRGGYQWVTVDGLCVLRQAGQGVIYLGNGVLDATNGILNFGHGVIDSTNTHRIYIYEKIRPRRDCVYTTVPNYTVFRANPWRLCN